MKPLLKKLSALSGTALKCRFFFQHYRLTSQYINWEVVMQNNRENLKKKQETLIYSIPLSVIIPVLILLSEHLIYPHKLLASSVILLIIGALITLFGFVLWIMTIRSKFTMIDNGWNPARKLVFAGMYRRVRLPMIVSEILIQAGGSILFASYGMAGLAVLNYIIHTVYYILAVEPDLEKRFGPEYIDYKKNVPRWLPRLKQWKSVMMISGKEG